MTVYSTWIAFIAAPVALRCIVSSTNVVGSGWDGVKRRALVAGMNRCEIFPLFHYRHSIYPYSLTSSLGAAVDSGVSPCLLLVQPSLLYPRCMYSYIPRPSNTSKTSPLSTTGIPPYDTRSPAGHRLPAIVIVIVIVGEKAIYHHSIYKPTVQRELSRYGNMWARMRFSISSFVRMGAPYETPLSIFHSPIVKKKNNY